MRLYFFRHGIAEDSRVDLPDADRALTEKGHRKLAAQATALRRLGWKADVLLTSPYVRAAETAAYVADVFGRAADPVGALASGADPDAYLAVLAVQPPEAHVWIVAHEPDLSETIRVLTGGRVKMRKGTLAVLDVDVPALGGATLRGLYDPDTLAVLADVPAAKPARTRKAAGETAPAEPHAEPEDAPVRHDNPYLTMPATKGQRRPKPR